MIMTTGADYYDRAINEFLQPESEVHLRAVLRQFLTLGASLYLKHEWAPEDEIVTTQTVHFEFKERAPGMTSAERKALALEFWLEDQECDELTPADCATCSLFMEGGDEDD